jgi:hypothetical protein
MSSSCLLASALLSKCRKIDSFNSYHRCVFRHSSRFSSKFTSSTTYLPNLTFRSLLPISPVSISFLRRTSVEWRRWTRVVGGILPEMEIPIQIPDNKALALSIRVKRTTIELEPGFIVCPGFIPGDIAQLLLLLLPMEQLLCSIPLPTG